MGPKAETICPSEILVKEYSALEAGPEKLLMGPFPLQSEIHSCRFLVMDPVAHEPGIGKELGARA